MLKLPHKASPALQKIVLLITVFFCLLGIGKSNNHFSLPQDLINSAEEQYGEPAKRRLIAWQMLIRNNSGLTDEEKLEIVNTFFNQLQFVDDMTLWKKSDYWATPVEFLAVGAGDCEDFSLAKYFTVKALGVAEKKINMTYVKALGPNQAHMVVTYYSTPRAIPLVLDNLVADIQPATARNDLLPVYSFNGSGLWLAKARGKGRKVASSDRLKRWKNLLDRMPKGLK